MNPLFQAPAGADFPHENCYSLVSLLRAMTYESNVYRAAWRDIEGANSVITTSYASGWPTTYSVVYHDDGVVVAFLGLRNTSDGFYLWNNSNLVALSIFPGRVMSALALLFCDIRSDIVAKVGAAPNKSKIVCVGHSSGGTLAMIAARELAADFPGSQLSYAMSIGAPRGTDTEFAASFPCPAFAVSHDADFVPQWPTRSAMNYVTSFLNRLNANDYAVCGRIVDFDQRGELAFSRSVAVQVAGDASTLTDIISNVGTLGPNHHVARYAFVTSRQLVSGGHVSNNTRVGKLALLGLAMGENVDPGNFANPVTPPSTAPVTDPGLPSIADMRAIPSAPIIPSSPPPPSPNLTFVPATTRVVASGTFTSSPRPAQTVDYRQLDADMIREFATILHLIARRDGALATPRRRRRTGNPRSLIRRAFVWIRRIEARDARITSNAKTRTLSTRAYMVDPNDGAVVHAWSVYKAQLTARLAALKPYSNPILNRANPDVEDSEVLLMGLFTFQLPGRR